VIILYRLNVTQRTDRYTVGSQPIVSCGAYGPASLVRAEALDVYLASEGAHRCAFAGRDAEPRPAAMGARSPDGDAYAARRAPVAPGRPGSRGPGAPASALMAAAYDPRSVVAAPARAVGGSQPRCSSDGPRSSRGQAVGRRATMRIGENCRDVSSLVRTRSSRVLPRSARIALYFQFRSIIRSRRMVSDYWPASTTW
jgi:hypothetical protein